MINTKKITDIINRDIFKIQKISKEIGPIKITGVEVALRAGFNGAVNQQRLIRMDFLRKAEPHSP